ncbi:MAG: hypothetical protein ABJH68_14125 [Ilumatobacter sp.]|uniref:hypothetical protein n=1 Tax=Ilumatobacter sp. TaxID=1967498 RepID=UPI0032974270
MGQLVAVTEKPSTSPGVVRFELNRTLSGQGHERFATVADAAGVTPSDELARLLFGTGKVAGVHVYANIVTVDLEKGFDSDGLADLVRNMYQYWREGVEPPTFEDLAPEEAESGGDDAAAAGGDAAMTEAAKRVPMHLLVRGREARERWTAKQG